ncbi:hypothetical protein DXV76_15425 [Rhodobacteraceae bacterium CCMM004]|nr:hypothetical protein DXV76_15425 [Rhodobacteraceae bacterium CCMM004]
MTLPLRLWIAALAALVAALTAAEASAGAWPRDTGRAFLSFSRDLSRAGSGPSSAYNSAYFEYGLGRDLTFGWRAGRGSGGLKEAHMFLRAPLTPPVEGTFAAAELGLGVRHPLGRPSEVVLVPGLSWGREVETRAGSGWAGVEATVALGLKSGDHWAKVDATFGISPRPDAHVVVQVRGYHDRGGGSVTLAPSYVHRLSPTLRTEIGVTQQVVGGHRRGVFVGTWMEF